MAPGARILGRAHGFRESQRSRWRQARPGCPWSHSRALCPQLGHWGLTLSWLLSLWNALQSQSLRSTSRGNPKICLHGTFPAGKGWEKILWGFQQDELQVSPHGSPLDHGMVWVGMVLKSHPVPPQGHLPLSQIPPSPIRPEIEHSRGGICNSPANSNRAIPSFWMSCPQTHPKSLFQKDPRSQNPPVAPRVTEKSRA